MDKINMNRDFMKSCHCNTDIVSDKEKGMPYPDLFKSYKSKDIIKLPSCFDELNINMNVKQCIESRVSRRHFSTNGISITELAYLLWSTQGLKKIIAEDIGSYRNVPSGGGKHAFETYLFVMNVESLKMEYIIIYQEQMK